MDQRVNSRRLRLPLSLSDVRLTFESDAVVVVAGVPGAGKTTLIRRSVDRGGVRVVDTDDQRAAGRRRLLSAAHYARIAVAIAGRRPVVIHSRGTRAAARCAISLLARLRGRPAHLILLDAGRAEAEAGQRARGRTVDPAEMGRQVACWGRLMAGRPAGEGWASIIVLDRGQAARTRAIEFVAAGRHRAYRRIAGTGERAAGCEWVRRAGERRSPWRAGG